MTRRFRTCVSLLALAAASGATADEHRADMDRNVGQWLSRYDVPSVAIAYIEQRKTAWTAVYGEQTPGVPATPKTLYSRMYE